MIRAQTFKFALPALVAMTLTAGPALAQSCQQLSYDLAQMENAAAGAPQVQFGQPRGQRLREINARLRKAQIQAARANCFGTSLRIFQTAPPPICGPIIQTITRLENELDQMRYGGPDFVGDPHLQASIKHLRGLMAQRGCGQPRYTGEGAGLPPLAAQPPVSSPEPSFASGERIRTMCVRTCDGYYFPISNSTTSDRISSDEITCQSQCPGAQTELYIQRDTAGGVRPEAMVSVTGQRYSDLPTALKYRTSVSNSCSCKAGSSFQDAQLPAEISRPQTVSLPRPAPDRNSLQTIGTSGKTADNLAPQIARTQPFDERRFLQIQPKPTPRPELAMITPAAEEAPAEAAAEPVGPEAPAAAEPAEPIEEPAPAEAAETEEPAATLPADNPAETAPIEDEATEGDSTRAVIGGRSVRIVGPAPWGVKDKEEVLQAPVRN